MFAAAEFTAPNFRVFTFLEDGTAKMLQSENFHVNSHESLTAFHDAGQFCCGYSQEIMESGTVEFSECSMPFLLPANRVVDIDTFDDWNRAE